MEEQMVIGNQKRITADLARELEKQFLTRDCVICHGRTESWIVLPGAGYACEDIPTCMKVVALREKAGARKAIRLRREDLAAAVKHAAKLKAQTPKQITAHFIRTRFLDRWDDSPMAQELNKLILKRYQTST